VAVGAGGIPEAFSQRFAAGCGLAMQEAGLQFGETWVMRDKDNLKWFGEVGDDPPACEWFLNHKPKASAIVGRAETIVGLLRGFARRGVKVPDDVSVVSHGPMGMALLPGHQMDQTGYSIEDMAEAGMDALGSRSRHCRRITVEVEMEAGESVRKI
jgi:DNA-binding LacI/PurR family transcriptional regulator